MGICPCARDFQDEKPTEIPCRESNTETLSTEGDQNAPLNRIDSNFYINLRSEEAIIRLVGPFQAYYRETAEIENEKNVRVSEAEYLSTRQKCLVKRIIKGERSGKAKAKTSVLGVLTKLDHPHILKTYEVCQDDKYKYIISESHSGTNLKDYLAVHTYLPQCLAATAIRQVLSALALVHSMGLSHRSLNLKVLLLKSIPVDQSMTVKVAGFEDYELTGKRDASVTIFRAPEMMNADEVTEKCDIWSCGVILYILLCGENPFEISDRSGKKVKYKGCSFPPVLWSRIGRDAVSLITSMMIRRPDARPTALHCLSHPWLRQYAFHLSLSDPRIDSCLSNMRIIGPLPSLKSAILQFIINRIMSETELVEKGQVFSVLDRNGDGVISREDLGEVVRELKRFEGDTDLILKRVDGNEDGVVSFSEFLKAACDPLALVSKENLELAFAALDKDKNGRISIQELKMLFRLNNTPGSFEQWKELIAIVDTSGDGEIDFSEFQALMMPVARVEGQT